jgi:dihydroorotate dehydrogenase (NAD+) catalytic subunit
MPIIDHARAACEVDLSVDLAGVRLANPVLTASGTSGYGLELADFIDLGRLGAFTTKSVTVEERIGNPPPRIVETSAGMLNAIGLANVGLERFVTEKVPDLQSMGIPIFVNVAGHSIDDYVTVCRRLDPIEAIAGLELNVGCPNVADGLVFGTNPPALRELVAAVRRQVRRCILIVKLSPNVTDITATARAAVEAGADVLSMVNTFVGMAIDIETWRPKLANNTGGLSGPAIKPMAVHMISRVYRSVCRDAGVPIIGMGGIGDWRDAVEFLLAGATALGVGTALFADPTAPIAIIEGLRTYLAKRGLKRVSELVGQAKLH